MQYGAKIQAVLAALELDCAFCIDERCSKDS